MAKCITIPCAEEFVIKQLRAKKLQLDHHKDYIHGNAYQRKRDDRHAISYDTKQKALHETSAKPSSHKPEKQLKVVEVDGICVQGRYGQRWEKSFKITGLCPMFGEKVEVKTRHGFDYIDIATFARTLNNLDVVLYRDNMKKWSLLNNFISYFHKTSIMNVLNDVELSNGKTVPYTYGRNGPYIEMSETITLLVIDELVHVLHMDSDVVTKWQQYNWAWRPFNK